MLCDGVSGGEGLLDGMIDFILFGGFGKGQTDEQTLVVKMVTAKKYLQD